MIRNSSSEDFAQTLTRLYKVLPSQFIEMSRWCSGTAPHPLAGSCSTLYQDVV